MKFIFNFLISLILISFLYILVIYAQVSNPTRMSQWVFDAYNKKEKIAKDIKTRKVILFSGSNTLFGIDSKALSKALKMPVVNYGVNSGVELPLMLHMVKKSIKKGDIVIAFTGYQWFSYSYNAGMQMIDYLFAREPGFFWKLTLKEQLYIVWHITAKRIYNGYFYKGGNPVNHGLYGAHHIDNNGDQINTRLSYKTKAMYKNISLQAKKPTTFGKEYSRDSLGWDYLSQFVSWCDKRNVTVIFMPITLMFDTHYVNDPQESWFYTNIANEIRKRGWTFIGDPYLYMYDQKFYFNTRYHLINRARHFNTNNVIQDLQKYKDGVPIGVKK